MPRLTLLVAALCTLVACDSAVPELAFSPTDPAALVGAWDLDAFRAEHLVTSTVGQEAVLLAEAGEGGIVLGGAVHDTLRYVSGRTERVGSDVDEITFYPSDRPQGDRPGPFSELSLRNGSPEHLAILSADGYYRARPTMAAPLFTIDGGRIAIADVELAHDSPPRRATATGTLTFPTVALEAGREQALPLPWANERVPHFTAIAFDADGTFEATLHPSFDGGGWAGDWVSDAPGRLGLQVVLTGGEPYQVDFAFAVEDGVLDLQQVQTVCEVTCDGRVANQYLAQPGTFAAVKLAETYRMTGR